MKLAVPSILLITTLFQLSACQTDQLPKSNLFSESTFTRQLASQTGTGLTPAVLIDSRTFGYAYGYGPSLIYQNGTLHMFYCSTGNVGWDAIRYSTSKDTKTWTTPTIVLEASDTTNERATCDPSVVYYDAGDGPYYYLFYSGNGKDIQTQMFVARSASISGPYLKYNQAGKWVKNPPNPKPIIQPIISTKDGANWYGAGQQSVVAKNGKLYSWYNDDTAGYPSYMQDTIYFTSTTNPTQWPKAVKTNVLAASIDVKYNSATNEFVMFGLTADNIFKRTSSDGITWSDPTLLCGTSDGSGCLAKKGNGDIGASGTREGHLLPGTFVGFRMPFDASPEYTDDQCTSTNEPYCWGRWNLYGTFIEGATSIGGDVKGYIDGVSDISISGWACARGINQPISIQLYAGGTATAGGTFVNKYLANVPSEEAVSTECGLTGTFSFRFSIPLTDLESVGQFGQKIYIYGLSPVGMNNNLLTNSGNLTVPIIRRVSKVSRKNNFTFGHPISGDI